MSIKRIFSATSALVFAAAAYAQPANDNCANAIAVANNSSNAFDTSTATNDGASSCGAGATDVWFTYTAPFAGPLTASLCGASYDTVISIIADNCGGSELVCNDDSCGLSSSVTTALTAGQVVMIRVAGFGGDTGSGNLNISQVDSGGGGPANDNCGQATALTNGVGVAFNTILATTDGSASCGFGSAYDVWYTFTATNDGTATVDVCGSTFDTVVSILDGCGGTQLACNDDFCGLSSTVSTTLTNGQTITIRVAGYNGYTGNGVVTVNMAGPPPPPDDLPATAQVPSGSGTLDSVSGQLGDGDPADMFKFTICDYLNFTASTVGQTGQDTQLFLFDAAGNAVQMNDDTPAGVGLQSSMGAEFVTGNGTYYIAISHFDNDPMNAGGAEIWADTPYGAVRAPDGPNGGDIQPASWSGDNVTSFSYTIALTGACYFEDTCTADFNHDNIVDFFDYLDFVDAFSNNDPSADFNHDDIIDFFDYLDFVDAFSSGC